MFGQYSERNEVERTTRIGSSVTLAYLSRFLKGIKKDFSEVQHSRHKKINQQQYVDTDAVDEE